MPSLQRFWFLETVARMPYFAYISMLHLYESLGWWRAGAELRKVRQSSDVWDDASWRYTVLGRVFRRPGVTGAWLL